MVVPEPQAVCVSGRQVPLGPGLFILSLRFYLPLNGEKQQPPIKRGNKQYWLMARQQWKVISLNLPNSPPLDICSKKTHFPRKVVSHQPFVTANVMMKQTPILNFKCAFSHNHMSHLCAVSLTNAKHQPQVFLAEPKRHPVPLPSEP